MGLTPGTAILPTTGFNERSAVCALRINMTMLTGADLFCDLMGLCWLVQDSVIGIGSF